MERVDQEAVSMRVENATYEEPTDVSFSRQSGLSVFFVDSYWICVSLNGRRFRQIRTMSVSHNRFNYKRLVQTHVRRFRRMQGALVVHWTSLT